MYEMLEPNIKIEKEKKNFVFSQLKLAYLMIREQATYINSYPSFS